MRFEDCAVCDVQERRSVDTGPAWRMAVALAWAGAGLLAAAPASAASFDCSRAASPIEQLVCTIPSLSALDDELAGLYTMRLQEQTDARPLRASQRRWLETRKACRQAECLAQRYEERAADLACLDGPVMGAAIGVATCAGARLRVLDRRLDAQDAVPAAQRARWRQARQARCRAEGEAAGGAPGWQAAAALDCEVKASEARLVGGR